MVVGHRLDRFDPCGLGSLIGVCGAPFGEAAVVGAEVDGDAVASEDGCDKGCGAGAAERVIDYCWSELIATTVRTRECVPKVRIRPVQCGH